MTTIRVGHLYPDYLNIYADRGNIAVLAARAPASISIRPASSATMAIGSSAGAEPLSSGIIVSVASI